MKYYIAFSIHGTNAFIVAERGASAFPPLINGQVVVGKFIFRLAQSRRLDHNPSVDGQKLHWDKLYRQTPFPSGDHRPLTCPVRVLSLFKQLEADGWTVHREKFMARHGHRFFRKAAHQ